MREILSTVRHEPAGPLLLAGNAVGLVLVIWLLVIA